jgi:hypothetical protein
VSTVPHTTWTERRGPVIGHRASSDDGESCTPGSPGCLEPTPTALTPEPSPSPAPADCCASPAVSSPAEGQVDDLVFGEDLPDPTVEGDDGDYTESELSYVSTGYKTVATGRFGYQLVHRNKYLPDTIKAWGFWRYEVRTNGYNYTITLKLSEYHGARPLEFRFAYTARTQREIDQGIGVWSFAPWAGRMSSAKGKGRVNNAYDADYWFFLSPQMRFESEVGDFKASWTVRLARQMHCRENVTQKCYFD